MTAPAPKIDISVPIPIEPPNKYPMRVIINHSDYIVCQHGGTPFKSDSLSMKFRRFLKANNLKHIRFHDLRHINATIMLTSGISPKVAQERLGHANYQITIPVPNSNTKPVAVPTEIIMLFNSDLMRLHARDRYFSFFMTPKR